MDMLVMLSLMSISIRLIFRTFMELRGDGLSWNFYRFFAFFVCFFWNF
jgi:hypothetical protein